MIHQGDCIDVLRTMEADSVDAVITDPPYMTTELKFDKNCSRDYLIRFYKETQRILKINGWFFMFGTLQMFADVLYNTDFVERFVYIWEKGKPVMQTHSTIHPFKIHEITAAFVHKNVKPMMLTYNESLINTTGKPYMQRNHKLGTRSEYECAHRIKRLDKTGEEYYIFVNHGTRKPTTILRFPMKSEMPYSERTTHPTQKPLGLLHVLIRGYTNKGDLVVDPFCGSGTTCIAAKDLGRRWVGIEREPEYVEIANARLRAVRTATPRETVDDGQLDLFGGM